MRCHYEVLGVPRDADDNEIKRSYRKLALQTHPDKHPEDHQRYTVLFREIQAAYEILSDPQERSWYDKHREAILRGDEEYVDDTLDLMHFFNPGVYSGFGDDDLGFYAVYGSAFQKIAEEDEPFVEEGIYEVPDFGNSTSLFEDVVKPFYGFWLSYCTKKSYVWAEKYDIRQAPNRPTQRLMEKENKKLRDAAKKKRNEEVRALVAFVRKRDKRVHEYRKQLELRQKEQKETTERKRLEVLRERQKKMENYQEQDWVAFDNMRNQLEDIEKHFDKEFGAENGESDGEDEHVEHFFCVACDKVFKSEKALANHEKSKKHKENVDLIKNEMEDDLVRDLHIDSEFNLEALLKEEQDGFKIADKSETTLHQAGTLPDLPKSVAKSKDASDAANKDPTFEEYALGVDEATFADNCCDSIRLAKQRKPTRQGSHDFKESKKQSKSERLVAWSSSDDETCVKDARDLFARDSLALPRKKTSKSKRLRQQAEKRRTEDPEPNVFLDASLGESSVCDSLRINKKRDSVKDKGSKLKGISVIAESTSSDGSSSEVEETITSRAAYQVELSVSEDVQAPSLGLKESTGGEEVVVDTDNSSFAPDDQVSYLKPVLGHSPLTDSIRIGKEKIAHHGKASLKQKKQKSRDRSSSSDRDQEVIETRPAESEPSELHLCSVCGKDYPSRNKLFEHIKAERHAAVKEVREKSKRRKGKNQLE